MSQVQAGDLQIHYLEKGSGTPIVFIHGNWAVAEWWEPVLARLPEGYRGIAYDMRGRGQTKGTGHGFTMPEMAADLLAFADALGLDKFHLVGHSLGTAVAMQFALEHGARLLSLTVLGPAWVDGMHPSLNAPEAQKYLKENKTFFVGSLKMMAPLAPEDELWTQLVEAGFRQTEDATLKNLPALLEWKPGDSLRAIAAPKLVISGEHDQLCGGETADRAAQALGTRHVVIPNVGHSPNLEAPDEFMRILMTHIQTAA